MTLILFATLLLFALMAWGSGAKPPPLSWEGLVNLVPIMLVAAAGGMVAFIGKVRAGTARWCNVAEIVGDVFVSAICGVFAYWLCAGFDLNEWITAAIVGISGHAGSRGLFMLERWVEARLDALIRRE